jgi:hypothetical protein
VTRPHDQPTMILPQVEPDAGAEGLWRTRLLLLGGLTTVMAVVVAVAVSALSPGERPATSAPAVADVPSAEPSPPAVTTETVTATSAVPFPTRTVRVKGLRKGERRVRVAGVPGQRRETYEVTYRDGAVVERELVGSVVVRQPVTEVVAVGAGKQKRRR